MELRFVDAIASVAPEAWNALAGPHPGLQHAYLHALEHSASVGEGSGWTPRHALLEDRGTLVAAMPLYEKEHSYGEYVFDWAWARAYHDTGMRYYPKWVAAIPFTPLPGPRLLARHHAHKRELLSSVVAAASAAGIPSLHLLFAAPEELALAAEAGLLQRQHVQFHWHNRGYADFDDFLLGLNHDKRKKIRQQRRTLLANPDLQFDWLNGHSATASDWDTFHRCYRLTYARHQSSPYLNASFFTALAAAQPDAVRLLRISYRCQPLACAFFLSDGATLYGRYWGSLTETRGLHFEACYYRPIAYAIEHGYQHFEGGAQGEHKLARGLVPVTLGSAHWIADPRFRDAIAHWTALERSGVGDYIDELETRLPFRNPAAAEPG